MKEETGSLKNLLVLGILGCVLMAAGDWLMIYGSTEFTGSLAWLTEGAAGIAPWRNTAAMALAFPAVALYAVALLGLGKVICGDVQRSRYRVLTTVGMTPWLCLHLFYIMILYLFAHLRGSGQNALAFSACEALFSHLAWVIFAGEAVMLLPFFYLFALTLKRKTVYPRWMAVNNPLLIYIILKLFTGLLPDCGARLAWTNGLMSESMVIWFLVLLIGLPKEK